MVHTGVIALVSVVWAGPEIANFELQKGLCGHDIRSTGLEKSKKSNFEGAEARPNGIRRKENVP